MCSGTGTTVLVLNFLYSTDIGTLNSFNFPVSAAVGETRCLQVSITDDDFVEDTVVMEFLLVLTTGNDSAGTFRTHSITVEDNDGKYSFICFMM